MLPIFINLCNLPNLVVPLKIPSCHCKKKASLSFQAAHALKLLGKFEALGRADVLNQNGLWKGKQSHHPHWIANFKGLIKLGEVLRKPRSQCFPYTFTSIGPKNQNSSKFPLPPTCPIFLQVFIEGLRTSAGPAAF